VYCVVVWQHDIVILCVLCGGVAACYKYGVCTVWWCGSVLLVWCVYCVVVWQRFSNKSYFNRKMNYNGNK